MKKRYWLYLSLTLVACLAVILGLNTNESDLDDGAVASSKGDNFINVEQESELTLEPSEQSLPSLSEEALTEPSMVSIDLTRVALKHQAVLQYPSYSQPIVDSNSPYLDWNKFEEVTTPVLDGNATATLSVNKYRHFYPDEIEVKLNSSASISSAELEVIDVETMKTLDVISSENSEWLISPSSDWPEEMRFVAKIDFDEGADVVTADIRFYHSVASILSIDDVYADGADLRIPVTLETEKEGVFRVRANLYDINGVALASLVTKEHLTEGQQTVELKAFKSVLPAGRSDLYLKDVMVERMSGYPGEKAGYGQSGADSYSIGSFDSNTLSDEGYQMSEQEKRQISFLKQVI
ncbi:hypothetical protein [Vibrio profundi]|uniref:hypothetical protein n=1 Tax=Vibrio profundi TaxID=1774960 RepID=UPI0037367D71